MRIRPKRAGKGDLCRTPERRKSLFKGKLKHGGAVKSLSGKRVFAPSLQIMQRSGEGLSPPKRVRFVPQFPLLLQRVVSRNCPGKEGSSDLQGISGRAGEALVL